MPTVTNRAQEMPLRKKFKKTMDASKKDQKYWTAKKKKEAKDKIIQAFKNGVSLGDALETDKSLPCRHTVYDWIIADDEFKTRFNNARLVLADWLMEDTVVRVLKMAERARSQKGSVDKIEIAAMDLEARTVKFFCSKLAPRVYGNTLKIETNEDGAPAIVKWVMVPTEKKKGLVPPREPRDDDQ